MRMNEAMLKALGYSQEEVLNTDYMATFVPEEEREQLSGYFNAITNRNKPTVNENHVLAKDGAKRLVEWHGRPIIKQTGEFDFFFGVGIDITERKRAAERILVSEKNYREIFNSASDAIIIVDKELRLTSI